MSNIYTNVSCYNNSNTNEKLNIDINIVNISLLGIIFVLLCYIYILKIHVKIGVVYMIL